MTSPSGGLSSNQGSSGIPLNSNGVTNSQRIFVQRDFRQGVAIRFSTEFPVELNGRIDQGSFDYTISHINTLFEEAEDFTFGSFCESCLSFITANLINLCRDTTYEKCLKRLSKFITEQNRNVYLPRGLQLTNPLERGLRCIEITILNDSPRS